MGFHQRVILYNKLIENFRQLEFSIGEIKSDLDDSLRNTDSNFPNKIEKLESQLRTVQLIEDQINELSIELYNFEP